MHKHKDLEKRVNNINDESVYSLHIKKSPSDTVAIGKFNVQCFDPGEKYIRPVVFHIVIDDYDFLEMVMTSLTTDEKNDDGAKECFILWSVSNKGIDHEPSSCLKNIDNFLKKTYRSVVILQSDTKKPNETEPREPGTVKAG